MGILNDYQQFNGLAWATGYLHNVLAYQGQPISEAMLMGINGGITAGYFVFEYQGYRPEMHFLTRYPFTDEPGAVFDRLCIPMQMQQTTDPKKAAANVLNALAKGKPAIVWADVASLPYFCFDHYDEMWLMMPLVVYGYDINAGIVSIADRARVPLTASLEAFERARARLKNNRFRMMTIDNPDLDRLPAAITAGIKACIGLFHGEGAPGAPGNFGFSGMRKWADAMTATKGAKSWSKQFAPGARMFAGLTSGYGFLETWFTGGSGARGIYADFLDEAAALLGNPALKAAASQFRESAGRWKTLADSLLPNHIPPFKEARELYQRDYHLFLTQGNTSVDERRGIQQRLRDLKAEMAQHFPLTEAEAAQMRAGLRDQVMTIHDAEQIAVQTLTDAIRENVGAVREPPK
jgi:hypothetical protein